MCPLSPVVRSSDTVPPYRTQVEEGRDGTQVAVHLLPAERDQLIDDITAIWLSLGETRRTVTRSRLVTRPDEYLPRASPLGISSAMTQRTRQIGQRIRDRE